MENSQDIPYLLLEIVSNILKRLPVKDILRYKIVSKSWCELIRSDYFIKLHLKQSQSYPCPQDQTLILACRDHRLYAANSNGLDYSSFKPIKLQGLQIVDIVGCCNGLLLCRYKHENFIYYTPNMDWDRYYHYREDLLAIVNPYTQRYRKIDKLEGDLIYNLTAQYGFGYDQEADDYKVVRIENSRRNGYGNKNLRVTVYSLRTDSSRVLGDEQTPFGSNDEIEDGAPYGALINNNLLHFLIKNKPPVPVRYRIYCFDVIGEKWSEVPLPKVEGARFEFNQRAVGVLDGCLCVDGFLRMNSNYFHNFWALKNYDIKDSWVKVFDDWLDAPIISGLQLPPILRRVVADCLKTKGTKILMEKDYWGMGDCLVWYNVVEKTIDKIDVSGTPPHHIRSTICIPRLAEIPYLES